MVLWNKQAPQRQKSWHMPPKVKAVRRRGLSPQEVLWSLES